MKKIANFSLTQREPILENLLRPRYFSEFIGQKKIIERLSLILRAAKERREAMDHILFCGPPGLGKTTLALILALEQGVDIKIISAPALQKSGDLVGILTSIPERGILFIDEIHRLSPFLEEILYSVMEDSIISIITGKGPSARVLKLKLPPITIVGATTRPGLLSNPLRDRFGFIGNLDFYSDEEIMQILERSQRILNLDLSSSILMEIAKRSRGTPRIANRLLKRVRDYIQVENKEKLNENEVKEILKFLGIDEKGLDETDRKILLALRDIFNGGPVGIKTLSEFLNESPETLEVVYEPYLLRLGFIQRTPRGRIITPVGLLHLIENKI
ncbi:MAG: Holliday junction branch migration DNA helicase RuvB [Dictyoglomus sp.]|nr:Holliday junction branch migration DNA helicase RuvB [Dictyoglomus sp.]MCX7942777.1 Holliday junction branch migration DNA helicase RuvB [Dictyoglomaceae bacterium]MDW8188415.1 Holliday junction branch migration DNA helicase RuvB [Dictyoglomus sp.]